MSRRNDQRVIADKVAGCTEDLRLLLGVTWDLSIVLRIASEAKQDHTGNPVLRRLGKSLNGIVHDRSTLAVSGNDHLCVGALAGSHADDLGSRGDGGVVGVLGHKVRREECWVAVLGANTLAGNFVGTELHLQTRASWWSGDLTLLTSDVSIVIPACMMASSQLTMLPISVDPRAMMNVTSLHCPSLISLDVIPSWRSSRLAYAGGMALTAVMPATRMVKRVDFIVTLDGTWGTG